MSIVALYSNDSSFSSFILSSISRLEEAFWAARFCFWSLFETLENCGSSRLRSPLKSSKRYLDVSCYYYYRMLFCLIELITCCFSDWIGFLNLGSSSKSIYEVQLVVEGSHIMPFWSNLTTRKSLSVLDPVLIFSKKLGCITSGSERAENRCWHYLRSKMLTIWLLSSSLWSPSENCKLIPRLSISSPF